MSNTYKKQDSYYTNQCYSLISDSTHEGYFQDIHSTEPSIDSKKRWIERRKAFVNIRKPRFSN